MKSKLEVYQHKDEVIHKWRKWLKADMPQDKYDIYFHNRYLVEDAWEKYDDLQQLDDDYVAYNEYELEKGNGYSQWKVAYPDKIQWDEYHTYYDELAEGIPKEDARYWTQELRHDGVTCVYENGPSEIIMDDNMTYDSWPVPWHNNYESVDNHENWDVNTRWFFNQEVFWEPVEWDVNNGQTNYHYWGTKCPYVLPHEESVLQIDTPIGADVEIPELYEWTIDRELNHQINGWKPWEIYFDTIGKRKLDFYIRYWKPNGNAGVKSIYVNIAPLLTSYNVFTGLTGYDEPWYRFKLIFNFKRFEIFSKLRELGLTTYISNLETYNNLDLDIYKIGEDGVPHKCILQNNTIKILGYIYSHRHGVTTIADEPLIREYDSELDFFRVEPIGTYRFFPNFELYKRIKEQGWDWDLRKAQTGYFALKYKDLNTEDIYNVQKTSLSFDKVIDFTADSIKIVYSKTTIIHEGSSYYPVETDLAWKSSITKPLGTIITDSSYTNVIREVGWLQWFPFYEIKNTFNSNSTSLYKSIETYGYMDKFMLDIDYCSFPYLWNDYKSLRYLRNNVVWVPQHGYYTKTDMDNRVEFNLSWIDENNAIGIQPNGIDFTVSSVEIQGKIINGDKFILTTAYLYNSDKTIKKEYEIREQYPVTYSIIGGYAYTWVTEFHGGYLPTWENETMHTYLVAGKRFSLTFKRKIDNNCLVYPVFQFNEWETKNGQSWDDEVTTITNSEYQNYWNYTSRKPSFKFEPFENGLVRHMTTKTDNIEHFFADYEPNFVDKELFDFMGYFTSDTIDEDSYLYGFSYDTTIFINDDTKQVRWLAKADSDYILNNWKVPMNYKPTTYVQYNGIGYELVSNSNTLDTWNILGIAWDKDFLSTNLNPIQQSQYLDWDTAIQEPYIPYYIETTLPLPAETYQLKEQKPYKVLSYGITDKMDDNSDTAQGLNYNVWKPNYDKLIASHYTTKSQYINAGVNKINNIIIDEFEYKTLVPTQNWPSMLFTDKHYRGTEIVHLAEGEDVSKYPVFGYYPPKREISDNPIKDPTYTGSFYRYIGKTHIYHTTTKAAEIYLPIGTDPSALNLTDLISLETPLYYATNSYSYDYAGVEEVPHKLVVLDTVSSTDFTAYPKHGYDDDYFYEYAGTNENLEFIWDERILRSNANYNIDINSTQDLTIGDVAGSSFSIDIQGTVRETIKYLGRKCRLYYDFKNKDDYKPMGVFTIDDIKFANHSVSTIVAYDNIKKFDKSIYDFLNSEEVAALYPMSAWDLFALVCDYCEVPYYRYQKFLNCDLVVQRPFGDGNITARQVMSYIAQIAGGYICCDLDGYVVVKNLQPCNTTLMTNNNEEYVDKIYETNYVNLPQIIDINAQAAYAMPNWHEYPIAEQKTQYLNEFPTELMDTMTYTSALGTVFIDFRNDINAIYDISDNPFIYNIEDETSAKQVLDAIIDQVWIAANPDATNLYHNVIGNDDLNGSHAIHDTTTGSVYSGNIDLFEWNPNLLGTMVIVLTTNGEVKRFIPTTISINGSGAKVTSKGQSTYSTKIINSEITKQVDSLKNSVKEVRLLIPDDLSTTIQGLNSEVGDLQSDTNTISGNLSTLSNAVSAQDTANETRFTAIESTNRTQGTNISSLQTTVGGHTTSIGQLQTTVSNQTTSISGLQTSVGTNTTNINALQSTVNDIPTTYSTIADNSITRSGDTITVESGGNSLTLNANNGILTITFGDLSWNIKLEVSE